MSVVIAIKEKNKIVMGCDSQVSQGQLKNKNTKNSCKVFKIKNCPNSLLGVVGYKRDSQLLFVENNLIREISILKNEINYEYVVKYLFNDIYEVLKTNNRIEKDNNGNLVNYIYDDFIFAYKNKAFLISGADGSVEEIEDYLCIGSGEEIAIGVLENNKDKSAKERIKEAIKSCSKRTIYVDNEVVIKTTKE